MPAGAPHGARPCRKQRPDLILSPAARATLEAVSRSRTEPARRVERAQILLGYAAGASVAAVARTLRTNCPQIERCVAKGLQLGAAAALEDLARPGRPARIPTEARAWLVAVACAQPRACGYPEELRTLRLLARHARERCVAAGHPSLARVGRGTVCQLLRAHRLRPHQGQDCRERRDPDCEPQREQVLLLYQQVQVFREAGAETGETALAAWVSSDEKPGSPALAGVAPDLAPQPGQHASTGRAYADQRLGTLTLRAGWDLLAGHVHRAVAERPRSREFGEFWRQLDGAYPPGMPIRVVLDKHSAHTSQETRAYPATVANRCEFVFTPQHGAWLNLVESFFSKLTRTLLREIRVETQEELKLRSEAYLDRVNEGPVAYRWTSQMDEISGA